MLLRKGFVDSDRGWKYVLALSKYLGKRDEYLFGIDIPIPVNLKKRSQLLYGDDSFNAIAIKQYEYTGFSGARADFDVSEKMMIINLCNEDMFGFGTLMVYEGDNFNLRNGEVIQINPRNFHSASSSFPFWFICIYQLY